MVDASWTVRGNEAQLQYTYRSLRGTLQPKDLPELVDRIDRAADLVVCRIGTGRRLAAAPATAVTSAARPPHPLEPVAAAAVAGRADASSGWLGFLVAGGKRRGRPRAQLLQESPGLVLAARGAIDLAHPTGADHGGDPAVRERAADHDDTPRSGPHAASSASTVSTCFGMPMSA